VTPSDADSATTGVFLYVNDVDAHYAAAEAAGAESCTAEGRPLRSNLFDARPRATSLVLHISANEARAPCGMVARLALRLARGEFDGPLLDPPGTNHRRKRDGDVAGQGPPRTSGLRRGLRDRSGSIYE
jgi:hypothetical protein